LERFNWKTKKINIEVKSKYLKIFLNIIVIIICFVIGYIGLIFSMFFFWGKHTDKKMDNELIITVGIYALFSVLILAIIYCFRNIWKIYKNK